MADQASKPIRLNIVEVPGGYRVTCEEFPDLMVEAATLGLAESLGVDAVNHERHMRDIVLPAEAAQEAALMEAVAKVEAMKARRGRPRKNAVIEGADVPE